MALVLASSVLAPTASASASEAPPTDATPPLLAAGPHELQFTVGAERYRWEQSFFDVSSELAAWGSQTGTILIDLDKAPVGPVGCSAKTVSWSSFEVYDEWSAEEWADPASRRLTFAPRPFPRGTELRVRCSSSIADERGWTLTWTIPSTPKGTSAITLSEFSDGGGVYDTVTYGPGAGDPTTASAGDTISLTTPYGLFGENPRGAVFAHLVVDKGASTEAARSVRVSDADPTMIRLELPSSVPERYLRGEISLEVFAGRARWAAPLSLTPERTAVRMVLDHSVAVSVQRTQMTVVVEPESGAVPEGRIIVLVDSAEVKQMLMRREYRGRLTLELPRIPRGTHQVVAQFELIGGTVVAVSEAKRLRVLI